MQLAGHGEMRSVFARSWKTPEGDARWETYPQNVGMSSARFRKGGRFLFHRFQRGDPQERFARFVSSHVVVEPGFEQGPVERRGVGHPFAGNGHRNLGRVDFVMVQRRVIGENR